MRIYVAVSLLCAFVTIVSCHGGNTRSTPQQPIDEEEPHAHAPAYGGKDKLEPHIHGGGAGGGGRGQDGRMNQGGQGHHHDPNSVRGNNRLHDKELTHDKDHIKEHLDGVADFGDGDMSDEELQFHYFKLHDYDNNNMLDGTELISAMTHYHHESEEGHGSPEAKVMGLTDNQISEMVDTIIAEDDLNDDGYIDYHEFMMSQSR